MQTNMTRRTFLKQGSLVVAVTAFSSPLRLFNASPVKAAAELPFKPHAFLEIAANDAITVWVGQTNLQKSMGFEREFRSGLYRRRIKQSQGT